MPLSLTLLFLLSAPINQIFQSLKWQNLEIENKKTLSFENKVISDLPDIYYIIPDGYTGASSLLKSSGFDNAEFYNYLKGKGFTIKKDALSNYMVTILSVPSSLNMDYIQNLDELSDFIDAGSITKAQKEVRSRNLQNYYVNNKLVNVLKNKGYKYVNIINSWAMAFAENDNNPDIKIMCNQSGDFYKILFKRTFLKLFLDLIFNNLEKIKSQ